MNVMKHDLCTTVSKLGNFKTNKIAVKLSYYASWDN